MAGRIGLSPRLSTSSSARTEPSKEPCKRSAPGRLESQPRVRPAALPGLHELAEKTRGPHAGNTTIGHGNAAGPRTRYTGIRRGIRTHASTGRYAGAD